jgi:replicative DNA helicase
MADLAERTDREDIKIKKQCEKLKALAKKYRIPIVAAVQLSGAPDERKLKGEDPKPVMRDLWGSIYLRATADVIMLLYREEYYHKQANPSLYDRTQEEALIIIAKNRSGVTDLEVPVLFKGYCTSFCDIESDTSDDIF